MPQHTVCIQHGISAESNCMLQHTVCIQHCTVSGTKLYATTHSLYTALYCQLNQTVCHNAQSVYSTVMPAEPNCMSLHTVLIQHCIVSWTIMYATTHSLYTALYCRLNQSVCHNTHSLYSTVLSVEPNCMPQHTVCIQHCTASWTKLTVQQAVRLNSRWRV